MESRRAFIKKASLLAGAAAAASVLPPSIQRALAIEAAAGSTYLDAEHIVFLMQENRSFDHAYGSLRGVRGFNDPRAITLPDGLPVWVQTNAQKESYAPFRLDIKNTKATWMGSLPHGWKDMVYARNHGKMDTWLEAKRAGNPAYRHMPLTMGYYNREDIPFYYAMADAFTVCDQHFCSSLTGTSANRSYFWSGTIREEPHNHESVAHVDNGQINYKNVGWKTYPERLQEAGIPWKVYQNELSLPVGFEGEEDDWLANFTDNNLEFSKQYNVRFHPAHRAFMEKHAQQLTAELAGGTVTDTAAIAEKKKMLTRLQEDLKVYTAENYKALPDFDREIHERAFVTNTADPDYHQLENIRYTDEEGEKNVKVPKGDIFHQFRKDVEQGALPTVSWLVAPSNFSDHPGSPWYGAWYVSEAMDILTKNPEVWKKTIFILTYDENDGYFDHQPPFCPPHSGRKEEGAVAAGLDTTEEYVTAEDEKKRTGKPDATLDNSIGLGFRVPLVIASPWTKGGWVNSEVFDHTSPLQFLEHFMEKKKGKKIYESNISAWRRLVCGNLTSVFQPAPAKNAFPLAVLDRNAYVERIFSAKTKKLPGNYKLLKAGELETIRKQPQFSPFIPVQEEGTRPACPIPYNLSVTAALDANKENITMRFQALGNLPKTKTIGVPFQVYAAVPYQDDPLPGRNWNFTVREEEPLTYQWPLSAFGGKYHLKAHGPNGFYNEFRGSAADPHLSVETMVPKEAAGLSQLHLVFHSAGKGKLKVQVRDLSYKRPSKTIVLDGNGPKGLVFDLSSSKGWYDLAIGVEGYPDFLQRFAGHMENGKPSISDPLMGRSI
jgi:phospholipase C